MPFGSRLIVNLRPWILCDRISHRAKKWLKRAVVVGIANKIFYSSFFKFNFIVCAVRYGFVVCLRDSIFQRIECSFRYSFLPLASRCIAGFGVHKQFECTRRSLLNTHNVCIYAEKYGIITQWWVCSMFKFARQLRFTSQMICERAGPHVALYRWAHTLDEYITHMMKN